MDKIVVKGGKRLEGTVVVEGAKNAVLPILTATLLPSEGQSVLTNVPKLSDVDTINNVLTHLNAEIEYEADNNT
ncbi:UDP-N-acetylglucosamine 1-carboxyvinyltransferase, partial [Bacillus subtilis]